MDNQNKAKLIQLTPNSILHIVDKDGNQKPIEVHTNVFADFELLITDKIYINILGKPPVKKIIYGLYENRGVQTAPGANSSKNS